MRVSEIDESTKQLIIIEYLINRVEEQNKKLLELWKEFKQEQKKVEEDRYARESFLYF